ncbi:hypothetical protein B0H13DRAFT_1871094 [Mycena leptocephala]|nr:hypothetical protein B0H13DRAFT_1871094 [Mycena leptocephala]
MCLALLGCLAVMGRWECAASGKHAQCIHEAEKAAGNKFILESLAIDATEAEAARPGASKEAKEGLVYDLDAHCTVKRGQNHHQTAVYPPTLRITPENPHPPSLSTLALENITYTHRAIILHFGTLVFMVRTFKIGIAFIFSTHVLAFPTLDMVFQPTWATSLTDFVFPPNIYTSTHDYLALVSQWIEQILLKPRHIVPVMPFVGPTIFSTHRGVHSNVTIFHGWSFAFLTLYEVFSNPSCTARFLLAFYSYVERSERDLWLLLNPCIHDGILAPTTEQRLRYADWLYVWAKHRTSLPTRMAGLVDAFHLKLNELSNLDRVWGRSTECELFDVFEPTFIEAGLKSELNLGHLMFGEDAWAAVGGKRASCDDPITALYRKHGLLSTSPKLKSNIYEPLFLPFDEFCEMWSITPDFPCNSHWSSDTRIQKKKNTQPRAAREITGNERQALLLKSIVTTSLGVSIGPLEYCGVGHIIHIGTAAYVAVCKGGPAIPEFHEKRALRGLDRISSHLESNGKRKRARSQKENNRLEKKISKIELGTSGQEPAGRSRRNMKWRANQGQKSEE